MDRHKAILSAIIKEFIETAEPVGSHAIVVGYNFSVSPATIRNEMANLEEEGFLFQPHTSAGRVPTDVGYRLYVDELADYDVATRQAEKALERVLAQYELQKAREKMYDAVRILSQATENVSFATLPDNRRTFYLGISSVLRQPEFVRDPMQASQVVEVLEQTDHFVNTLNQLGVEDEVKIFIGEENLLPQIKSCALIVSKYKIQMNKERPYGRTPILNNSASGGVFSGYFGILGPTRMQYPFNHAMVRKVRELIEA